MHIFIGILLVGLIVCAVATCINKSLLVSITIFMAYSLIMSIIWIVLQSAGSGDTEAAVGAGVTPSCFL